MSASPSQPSLGVPPAPSALTGPPRPPLVFRVGIVGHRPHRLKKADRPALSNVIREILSAAREAAAAVPDAEANAFASSPPCLRALSPLAEGSDRLFAEEALNLGFELCCPMPFPQEEFEKDFAAGKALEPDSLARFRGLLERARAQTKLTVLELDGRRGGGGEAYGTAGSVVLNQSDLLLVVWDGERSGLRGGTEETFAEAGRKGAPVVWIHAAAPHACRFLDAGGASEPETAPVLGLSELVEAVRKTVRRELALPEASRGDDGSKGPVEAGRLADFYAEKWPRRHWGVVWKWFRNLVGDGTFSKPEFGVKDFETAVEGDWPRDESSASARIVNRLRPFYAWTDKLADLYADAYRSAFLVTYLLAAFAVGMALLPVAARWFGGHSAGQTLCIWAEFLMILAMLALVVRGKRRHWHERWIDYRLAAELIRHLRLVAPFGKRIAFPQPLAHWASYRHPGATWVGWYVRAVGRAIGLPAGRIDKVHLKECRDHLAKIVEEQVEFHRTTSGRYGRLEKRLHWAGVILLALTLLACGVHLLPAVAGSTALPSWLPWLLTFLCGFLPALGAALAGINNQGEFLRIQKRSRAMARELKEAITVANELAVRIESLADQGDPEVSSRLEAVATQVGQLMVNEVLDWRVVFLDRPLASTG